MSDELIPAADLLEEQGFPEAAKALRGGRAAWVWMPHPAHFICAHLCRFHLATFIPGRVRGRRRETRLAAGVIVSTVGEYWPERDVREIYARHHDPEWLEANRASLGDDFDRAYLERFGFQEVGLDRLYETMVFPARKGKQACCPYEIYPNELEVAGANEADAATENHYRLCKAWAARVTL